MTLFNFKKTFVLAAAAVVISAASAYADTITFTLDNSNISTTGSPYVEVDGSLSGQIATFTFTAENGYVLLDGSAAGLNINSSSFTESFVSATPSGVGTNDPAFKSWSSGNVDGFGSFNLLLTMMDGYGWSSGSITFTVTNTGSTQWNSINDVLLANTNGGTAVAHYTAISSGGSCTGFASDGTTTSGSSTANCTSVPDGGSTVTLLGSALVAFGMLARRLRKS